MLDKKTENLSSGSADEQVKGSKVEEGMKTDATEDQTGKENSTADLEEKESSEHVVEEVKESSVLEDQETVTDATEEVVEEIAQEPAPAKAEAEPPVETVLEEATTEIEMAEEDQGNNVKDDAEPEEEKVVLEKVVSEDDAQEVKAASETAEQVEEETQIPVYEPGKLNLEELISAFENLLYRDDIKDVKSQIESLKSHFQKKFRSLIAEKKAEFVKGGGDVADFFFSSPVKGRFDELVREFKKKRQQFYMDMEREQKENLEVRRTLIEELKDLIDNAEPSSMYKNFKNLQERWRSVGQIPHADYNDVWRTYHHHVERFYDLLHLSNDFRDLDFKHNLEEKLKLIEKAEELAEHEDINYAFKELQILHRLWKEDVGPVAREHREEVWNRFSEATKNIHQRRHDFQDKLDEKYQANVDLKLAVIEKIAAIDPKKISAHKEWQDGIKKMEELREEFFAIGKVPKSRNEEIWQLFRNATREFNAGKNAFYKGLKKEQLENLEKKMELVELADSMKDSDDWDTATELFKKIQADWKKIGHVPRKDSDKVWKRFKQACNHYFDRLHEKRSDISKDQAELIEKKKEFLEEVKASIDKGKDLTMEWVDEKLKHWRNLGALPAKVKHLEGKFGKVLDAAYKKLNVDKEEVEFLRFQNLMNSYLEQNNTRKLDGEQLFIRRRIDEITREIKQLENNISFISNASADNPLVKNVYKNIETFKSDLRNWERKLDYLSQLDY